MPFRTTRTGFDEPAASVGGLARNRTGVQGFAVLCVTTPPRGLAAARRSTRALLTEGIRGDKRRPAISTGCRIFCRGPRDAASCRPRRADVVRAALQRASNRRQATATAIRQLRIRPDRRATRWNRARPLATFSHHTTGGGASAARRRIRATRISARAEHIQIPTTGRKFECAATTISPPPIPIRSSRDRGIRILRPNTGDLAGWQSLRSRASYGTLART